MENREIDYGCERDVRRSYDRLHTAEVSVIFLFILISRLLMNRQWLSVWSVDVNMGQINNV